MAGEEKEEKEIGETPEESASETDQAVEEYLKKKRASKEEPAEEEEAPVDEEKAEKVEILEEEEKVKYPLKQKPELSEATRKALELRKEQQSKLPRFRRQEWYRYKRLGTKWRRPKGLHSKMRKNLKYRPPRARVGYGKVKKARGLHPSGFEDILVHNLKELEALNPKTQAARIAGGVGGRKREHLQNYAKENNIRVLNWKEVSR